MRVKIGPFKTGIAILKAIHDLYPKQFAWKQPPYEYEYEYEYEKMPFDILAGTDKIRLGIEGGEDLKKMAASWTKQCEEFDRHVRKKFLIYK